MGLRGEKNREWIVWTFYLDKRKSRSKGRKIARRLSVPNVKLTELVQACKALGIPCRVEEKKYPKCWWEEGGRVLVPKIESKPELLRRIAAKIAELRGKGKGSK